MKRPVSLLIVLCLLLSSVPFAHAAGYDDDVSGSWEEEVSAALTVEGSRATLSVKGASEKTPTVYAFIAAYDEEGRVTFVKSFTDVSSSFNEFTTDVPEGAAKFKGFILDADCAPLTENRIWTPYSEVHNVLFFGDGFISANQMGDTFIKLAEADGIKINCPANFTYNTISTTDTYNLYSLFKFDGEEADSKVTGPKNNWIVNSIKEAERYNYDTFICEVSRDRGISDPSVRGRNLSAMEYYSKEMNKIRPGFKTVHLAPAGYLPDNDGALAEEIGLNYTGFESHNRDIREYAEELEGRTAGAQSSVLICDAFEYFMNNYASADIDLYDRTRIYPSMAGSYYIACVLYSSIFGNATSGIDFYGYITDVDACKTLQEAADNYVAGAGVTLKPHVKYYTSRSSVYPLTLEQADPRNLPQKPEFAHEVYPEYYDELLSSAFAYYQRLNLVQYDSNYMVVTDDPSIKEHRREVDKAINHPEDATPQNTLYFDCSSFIYALFNDAFDFDFNGANRCASIFKNEELNATPGWRVFFYDGTQPNTRTAKELSNDAYGVLQPGDILLEVNEAQTGGHIMLYVGNGKMIHLTGHHASGGGENYLYTNGTDNYEMINGILYEDVAETLTPGHWLFVMGGKWNYVILRPSALNLKPTDQAKNRLNNLRNVVAYKLTTAPQGVTVSPGSDVTFTVVINNLDYTAKTINITDKISDGLTLKSSKDFKASGKDLSATVTVPAGKKAELSYTVTVNSDVAPGRTISCRGTCLNGVLQNDAPILVGNTLTAERQNSVPAAADAAGAAASTDYEFISAFYKDSFDHTLPGSSSVDLYNTVFELRTGTTRAQLKRPYTPYLAGNFFGGKYTVTQFESGDPKRAHRIKAEYMVPGDVILTSNDKNGKDAKVYLYLGDGIIATVDNGVYKKYSKLNSQVVTESLLSCRSYCILRPSLAF
ncbi:MAG: C40 family peptidase [Clostridia bacterium]|nr:C40 family peptidase [Clostridia bacterium]